MAEQVARNVADAQRLLGGDGPASEAFRSLRATRAGNVFAVDANTYFARPSPSLAAGAALAARCAFADEPPVVAALQALSFLPPDSAWQRLRAQASRPAAAAAASVGEIEEVPASTASCWELHARAVSAAEEGYVDPETGYFVFSEVAHRQRGFCCGNGCRHCPYAHVNVKDKPAKIQQPSILRWQTPPQTQRATSAGAAESPDCHHRVLFFDGAELSMAVLHWLLGHSRSEGAHSNGQTATASASVPAQASAGVWLLACFDAVSRQAINRLDAVGKTVSFRQLAQLAAQLRMDLIGCPLQPGLDAAQTVVKALRLAMHDPGVSAATPLHVFCTEDSVEARAQRESELAVLCADGRVVLHFPVLEIGRAEVLAHVRPELIACDVDGASVGALL